MKVIAEIGLAHEGSLGTALAYIDACAAAGVNAVKFQCHEGDTVNAFRKGTNFPQDSTRQEYWKRTGFKRPEWRDLSWAAHEKGLEFWVSVFSLAAVDYMADCGLDAWKLGSGNASNSALIVRCSREPQPTAISFGMSDWKEISGAVIEAVTLKPSPILFQCTSCYPCPAEAVGLNILAEFRKRFPQCPVGLSDHSGKIWPGLGAAVDGADYLEVHVTFSRHCFGPDVSSSLTIDELRQLVEGVRYIERMKPVDKDSLAASMGEMREVFCA